MKFIYIKDNDSSFKELNLNKFQLFLVSISVFLFIIAPTFIISYYIAYNNADSDFVDFKDNKIKTIESDIENSRDDIDYIKNQLNVLQLKDNNLRSMVGLPIIPEDIRQMGTGGKSGDSDDLNYYFEDEFGEDVYSYVQEVDFLKRSIGLQKISIADISNHVDKNLDKILRFPAIHPIDINLCEVTSGFGKRRDPYTRKYRMHDGQDFSGKRGTPIYATANGIVKSSKYYGSYGNYIEIDHGNGYTTVYAHLNKRRVKRGTKVERGQRIGDLGNTGRSTANHLHYEVKYRGKAVDPQDYFFDRSVF